jgi:hypothetical protein
MPAGGGPPPIWGQQHPLVYAAFTGTVSVLAMALIAVTKGNFNSSAILGYLIFGGIVGVVFGVAAFLWRRFVTPN